jgi:hypothetical protein
MTTLKPSEFEGHRQRNTLAPPVTPAGTRGHEPTPSERLRLTYLTGQSEDSTALPVDGVMEGLLPADVQAPLAPKPRKWADS